LENSYGSFVNRDPGYVASFISTADLVDDE